MCANFELGENGQELHRRAAPADANTLIFDINVFGLDNVEAREMCANSDFAEAAYGLFRDALTKLAENTDADGVTPDDVRQKALSKALDARGERADSCAVEVFQVKLWEERQKHTPRDGECSQKLWTETRHAGLQEYSTRVARPEPQVCMRCQLSTPLPCSLPLLIPFPFLVSFPFLLFIPSGGGEDEDEAATSKGEEGGEDEGG